jgi:hypothetical protein
MMDPEIDPAEARAMVATARAERKDEAAQLRVQARALVRQARKAEADAKRLGEIATALRMARGNPFSCAHILGDVAHLLPAHPMIQAHPKPFNPTAEVARKVLKFRTRKPAARDDS